MLFLRECLFGGDKIGESGFMLLEVKAEFEDFEEMLSVGFMISIVRLPLPLNGLFGMGISKFLKFWEASSACF